MAEIISPGIEPVYVPRRFAAGGTWEFGDLSFKVHLLSYEIAHPPFHDHPDIVEDARKYVSTLLADMDGLGEHFGLGYVILHEGDEAENYWLLFDWWIPGGINCRILSRALHSSPLLFERVQQPYVACVWESISAEYERVQWVANVLGGPRDRQAYLRATMPEGLY